MFVVTGRETILAQAGRESASLCRWYCPLSVGTVRCRRRFVLVVCWYYPLSAGIVRCPSSLCRCRLLVVSVVGVPLTLLFVGIGSCQLVLSVVVVALSLSFVGIVRRQLVLSGVGVALMSFAGIVRRQLVLSVVGVPLKLSFVGIVCCRRRIDIVICWYGPLSVAGFSVVNYCCCPLSAGRSRR